MASREVSEGHDVIQPWTHEISVCCHCAQREPHGPAFKIRAVGVNRFRREKSAFLGGKVASVLGPNEWRCGRNTRGMQIFPDRLCCFISRLVGFNESIIAGARMKICIMCSPFLAIREI